MVDIAVTVDLQEYTNSKRGEANGNVHFELLFNPASLDNFVKELFSIAKPKEGSAILLGRVQERE